MSVANPATSGNDATETETRSNYLNASRGLLSWLFTLDHKRIGLMYLIAILSSFFLGGVFALLLRTELLTPETTVMTADSYNKMFTLHGAVMIFLFIIPGIPATLGNFVLPLMLGAKDVALPRLNLASFWLWITGAMVAIGSILMGGVDTGWTFYTPYSTTTGTAVISMTLGAFILGFSSIFTGLNFIVTIHKMRPEGMTWFRMPLFLWGIYSTAIIQVLATGIGDAGARHHAVAVDRRADPRRRDLRPRAGRRSGAVPALLLVLLAPGGLHHDSARDGDHV